MLNIFPGQARSQDVVAISHECKNLMREMLRVHARLDQLFGYVHGDSAEWINEDKDIYIYIYIYICVYICIYIYMNIYICIYMCIEHYLSLSLSLSLHIYIDRYIYIYIYMYMRI